MSVRTDHLGTYLKVCHPSLANQPEVQGLKHVLKYLTGVRIRSTLLGIYSHALGTASTSCHFLLPSTLIHNTYSLFTICFHPFSVEMYLAK